MSNTNTNTNITNSTSENNIVYSFDDLPSEKDYQYSVFELLIYFIFKTLAFIFRLLAHLVPFFIVYFVMYYLIKLFFILF